MSSRCASVLNAHCCISPCHCRNRETGELRWHKLVRIVPRWWQYFLQMRAKEAYTWSDLDYITPSFNFQGDWLICYPIPLWIEFGNILAYSTTLEAHPCFLSAGASFGFSVELKKCNMLAFHPIRTPCCSVIYRIRFLEGDKYCCIPFQMFFNLLLKSSSQQRINVLKKNPTALNSMWINHNVLAFMVPVSCCSEHFTLDKPLKVYYILQVF